MNLLFLPNQYATDRLIILFLGWGCPPECFRRLSKPGYDLLIISDYVDWNADTLDAMIASIREPAEDATSYCEIVVVAWSFGVRMAADFIDRSKRNITLRLAINGSIRHIDDNFGIPRKIFDATIDGLSQIGLRKFRLRTAGSKTIFENCLDVSDTPEEFERYRRELVFFGKISEQEIPESMQCLFDKAVVGTADRIFPPENLRREWERIDIFEEDGMAHLPDFQRIFDRYIVDKSKVEASFQQAAESYAEEAVAQKVAAEKLFDLFKANLSNLSSVASISPGQPRILEVGYGDGSLTSLYIPLLPAGTELHLCDLKESEAQKQAIQTLAGHSGVKVCFHKLDIESLSNFRELISTEDGFDLIVSGSTIQWLNSPAQFVSHAAEALAPKGILAISYYGEGTLREISLLTGNGLKYPSLRLLENLVNREFPSAEIETFEESQQMEFPSAIEAMRHLKATGVNALPTEVSPVSLRRLLGQWPVNDQGCYSLTFESKCLIVRK